MRTFVSCLFYRSLRRWLVEQMEFLGCLSFFLKKMILGILGFLEKLKSLIQKKGAHWLVSSARVSSTNLRSLDCMLLSCHVRIQSESTLYSCLNVKELLSQSRREIWSFSDYNWTWTHNHLVHKRTLYELSGCGFESSCSHLRSFVCLIL